MARKKRRWVPGDFFHIYNRGNRLRPIFHTDEDRKIYLRFLEKSRLRYPFRLHAYSLMTNHLHLLIETIDHSPTRFMQHAHSLYAQYFNREHALVGHLFQGRYQALHIDSPEYFHQAGAYIHRNPLKANLRKEAQNPLWSSYPFYILPNSRHNIIPVTIERLLEYYRNPEFMDYRLFIEAPLTTAILKPEDFPALISGKSSHPFDTPFLPS